MLSESSQDGENHAQPIILTRHAFMSLPEIERKDMLSSVVMVKDDERGDSVQSVRSVLIHSLVVPTLAAHTHCSNYTVVSVIPASGAVSEYSVTACGFEGLQFEEPISGTMIDYALRYVPPSTRRLGSVLIGKVVVIVSTCSMHPVDQIGTRI
jgi:hypothetical protein